MKGLNNRQKKNVRIKREYRKVARVPRGVSPGIGKRPKRDKTLKTE